MSVQQFDARFFTLALIAADIGGHFIKVDGISPNGTIVVAIRLADNGSCAPWLDNAHEEGKRALEQPLQSKLHDMLARNDIQIQVPPLFTRFFVTTLLAPLTGVAIRTHICSFTRIVDPRNQNEHASIG